jgi:Domain of unknown function (DUF5753)
VDDALYTADLDLASVTTHGELAEFLRTIHVRADKPSFRSLEARTRHHPTRARLSKTVVSEMLSGVRFPKKAVMVSFLQTCGVPDDRVEPWSRAWERIAGLAQGSRPPGAPTGQARKPPYFGARQSLPEDSPAESVGPGSLIDTMNSQIELLRNQIGKLDADNRRLRQQLGKQQAWWQSYDLSYETYVSLEADALIISAFQSSVVHGLLQTAEYARAGHEGAMPRFSPERIEMQIEAKLIRQGILMRDDPPRLAVVLDEAALHRMVGGRLVMADQLTKILDMSALPNVIVQVLPFERGAHPALESNFTVLELPSPAPGVVYIEGIMGSIYLRRPEELKRSQELFSKLQSIALSREETSALIANLSHSYSDIDISHKQ